MAREISKNGITATLWQKNGNTRIYLKNARGIGMGSYEKNGNKWVANNVAEADKPKLIEAFSSIKELAIALYATEAPIPTAPRGWEYLNPNAEAGQEGHICG